MKTNLRVLLAALGVLGVGLLLGYLLFGRAPGEAAMQAYNHAAEQTTGTQGAGETHIWTCSMHPQIQREEPGDCPICGMELIPLAHASNDDPTVLTMTEAAVALARVQTTAVGGGRPPTVNGTATTVELSGRLAADERATAVQSAHVPGRIERLYVTFTGERVQSGQRIAEVYSPELVGAQAELLEAIRFEDVNPALVEAAREKLRNLRIGSKTIARIEARGTTQENFTLFADAAGIVLDKQVQVGDYVTQGQPLFTLTRLDELWALFDAYEGDVASIRVGDPVRFTTPAVPGRDFQAKVTFIDPLLNPQTRTASVRAEVSNSRGLLKPQMFVRGEVELQPRSVHTADTSGRDAPLTVPATAVLWTGSRSVVYVEVPDVDIPTYKFREVRLGERVGDGYEVSFGLEPGERVVTNGAFSIDAAAQLNNQFSMMNRDVIVQGTANGVTESDGSVEFVELPDYTEKVPETFRAQLGVLAQAYLPIKDAMVAGEVRAGQLTATRFGESLSGVNTMLLEGEAHSYWMEQLEALQAHAAGVASAAELEVARRQFGFLSRALINTLTAFGISDQTLYVDHCPMAFGNEGANWLSESPSIENPFFGEVMLTCGSVIDTLRG